MVTEVQFVATAAFLIWCLACSLAGLISSPDTDETRLIWREHGPAGWGSWHVAPFGLTASDRRALTRSADHPGGRIRGSVLDAVCQWSRQPDSDAVQYAVVRTTDQDRAAPVFVSEMRYLESVP
jgi:hypothetical protein